jgi:hypothetical protein
MVLKYKEHVMLMRHQEIQYVPAQAIEVETIVKVIQHCYCNMDLKLYNYNGDYVMSKSWI